MTNQPGDEKKTNRWIAAGFLMPLSMVLLLCFDLMIGGIFPKQAMHAEGTYWYRMPNSPFQPNQIFKTFADHRVSDATGLPRLEPDKTFTFPTDAFGYHNDQGQFKSVPPEIIVSGDSFSVIGGDKDELLPNQLAALSGRSIYNASHWTTPGDAIYPPVIQSDPSRVIQLAKKLNMPGGIVIFESWTNSGAMSIKKSQLSMDDQIRKSICNSIGRVGLGTQLAYLRGIKYRKSPVNGLARSIGKVMQDYDILPTKSAGTKLTLINGEPIYFFDMEFNTDHVKNPCYEEFCQWYQRKLAKHGLQLLVVLVPNKFSVYQSLLKQQPKSVRDKNDCLEWLEQRLSKRNIPLVNLTKPMREAASEQLKNNQYLYWRDDHHWNERGIKVAAGEINKALERMDPSSEP